MRNGTSFCKLTRYGIVTLHNCPGALMLINLDRHYIRIPTYRKYLTASKDLALLSGIHSPKLPTKVSHYLLATEAIQTTYPICS